MTRVLPEPAPARINKGPSPVVTASRCCGLSCERKSVMKIFISTFKHTDQFAQTLRLACRFLFCLCALASLSELISAPPDDRYTRGPATRTTDRNPGWAAEPAVSNLCPGTGSLSSGFVGATQAATFSGRRSG